jgi:hypothetical protein
MSVTKLDALLESIDPVRSSDQTRRLADIAINSFPLQSSVVTSWEQFRDIVSRFVCHVENTVLKIHRPCDPDFDLGRALRLLRKDFGPNADIGAAQIAISGVEGGLYRVLKSLTTRMVEEYSENEVAAKVSHYWSGLTIQERLDASREYLQKFGHLLPGDVTEGSAPRVRAYLPQFLKQHPRLVGQLRGVGHGR